MSANCFKIVAGIEPFVDDFLTSSKDTRDKLKSPREHLQNIFIHKMRVLIWFYV